MPWTSSAIGPATRTPSACSALEDFAKEHGYRLRSEDFVDQGYYNAACRVPSERYLDWMNFIHRFVVKFGKALVDKAHKAGKRTAIFWGDHWIGVEPYLPSFLKMGIDIHVGAAEDGVALRRISDTPGRPGQGTAALSVFLPRRVPRGRRSAGRIA